MDNENEREELNHSGVEDETPDFPRVNTPDEKTLDERPSFNTDNLERQGEPATGGYTGSYEGGNVAAMYKQFNGQMAAMIEAAFVLILLVLIYYLYNGKVVSYNMKVAACVVGGIYFLNEFLVYQGKPGGVVGMMSNVMNRQ